MMRSLLAFAFIVAGQSIPSKAFSQTNIPFAFISDEDNRLIKENDSFKYYVAIGDTTNIVCLDEEASYYKLLNKDHKVIAEGAFTIEADKYLQQGKWGEYYPNGKPKRTGYYSRSIAVGTWQEYYNTGKLKTVSNYAVITDEMGFRNTCMSGTYQEYYPNGKLKTNGLYAAVSIAKNDTMEVEDPTTGEKKYVITHHSSFHPEKTGQWEHYDENGELEKKEEL